MSHSTALSGGPRRAAFARWGAFDSAYPSMVGRRRFTMRLVLAASVVLLVASAGAEIAGTLGPQPASAPSRNTTFAPRAFVESHCLSCHNDRARIGGLSLSGFDGTRPADDAELFGEGPCTRFARDRCLQRLDRALMRRSRGQWSRGSKRRSTVRPQRSRSRARWRAPSESN